MRSISCIVCAVKYDSPQCGHDQTGMLSMTKSDGPRPKLRVTLRTVAPSRPHEAQTELDTVGGDDKECTAGAELDDRFGFDAFK